MIPVLDLKKLHQAVENQTPEQREKNRIKANDLLQAAIRSTEEHKRVCEELGIPYIPCVALDRGQRLA